MPGGGTVLSYDPVYGTAIGSVDATVPSSVRGLVEEARAARSLWWDRTLKGERLEALRGIVRALSEGAEGIALTVCRETGRPMTEVLTDDVLGAIVLAEDALEMASHHLASKRMVPSVSDLMGNLSRETRSSTRPHGVVGVISSCSYPFGYPFCHAFAALASGNAVVIKPSPRAPMSAQLVEELIEGSGVPPGVVRIAHGGRCVGHALASAGPDVMVIQGKASTARNVRETVPLGTVTVPDVRGDVPMLVLGDADIDAAVRAAAWSIRMEAGQSRWSVKRLLVDGSVRDAFVRSLCDALSATRMGHEPGDPDIDMGPLLDRMRVERAERGIGDTRAIVCGMVPDQGPFMAPRLLLADAHIDPVMGPVASVSSFDGQRGAVRAASALGECAAISVWTRNIALGTQLTSMNAAPFRFVNQVPCLGTLPLYPALPSTPISTGVAHAYESGTLTITDSDPDAAWWGPSDGSMKDSLLRMIEERSARMDPLERVRTLMRM